MNTLTKIALLGAAWFCFALGVVGIFVPVLPTTPLILLATFLFAKASPRWHKWVSETKVYKTYVVPFKESGGIPASQKVRILVISYTVLALSAFLVQKIFVWAILCCVAVFLCYLMLIRIPTLPNKKSE